MKSSEGQSGFLLCVDELQPGDVILTHGGELFSKAIAVFGGGSYSHAALYIGGTLIYESDAEAPIGLKSLESFGMVQIDGRIMSLVELPGTPTRCSVLRHAQMEDISEERFSEALTKLMRETQGLNYSRYEDLIAMAKILPGPFKAAIAFGVRRYDNYKARQPGHLHGHFCSEVVAKLYENLGLPISRLTSNPAKLTTPFDFPSAGSHFHDIRSVVIPRDLAKERIVSLDGDDPWIRAEKSSAALLKTAVETANATARAVKQLAETTRKLRAFNESLQPRVQTALEESRQRVIKLRELLPTLADEVIESGNMGDLRRMIRLGNLFASLEEPLIEAPLPSSESDKSLFWSGLHRLSKAQMYVESLFYSNLLKRKISETTEEHQSSKRSELLDIRRKVLLTARESFSDLRATQASSPPA